MTESVEFRVSQGELFKGLDESLYHLSALAVYSFPLSSSSLASFFLSSLCTQKSRRRDEQRTGLVPPLLTEGTTHNQHTPHLFLHPTSLLSLVLTSLLSLVFSKFRSDSVASIFRLCSRFLFLFLLIIVRFESIHLPDNFNLQFDFLFFFCFTENKKNKNSNY